MITVSVSLPDYLAQWANFRLEARSIDNRMIICPVKGSPVAQFLRNYLRHKKDRPLHQAEPKKKGAIIENVTEVYLTVPHFPGRDPQYYNYLSPVAEAQLRDLIRSRFDIELYSDFSKFKNVNTPTSEFIFSWLDSNGIEPTEKNWLAVDKRLQLLRRRAADRIRKRK